jgi:hypothetical protein
MNGSIVSGRRRLAALVLAAALAGGCQPAAREPRRLAFPTFRAEALFPEYQSAARATPAGKPTTQFARDLNAMAGGTASAEPEAQNVPLGSSMIAQIPDEEGWTWSLAEGATLVTYSPAGGRPGALIYAEAFSPLIHEQPSAEHLRFQLTVNRGLGFRPSRGTFTGWRWVGRNAQGVTLRCGRYLGLWAEARVSSSLILGSATARDEETGVHFAVLCVREPRCLVYKELARFFASVETAEASLMERLRSTPPIAFPDLVKESGLAILPSSS